jgi:hypothetical protein
MNKNKSTTTTYHIEINGGPVDVSRIEASGKADIIEVDDMRLTIAEASTLVETIARLLYGDDSAPEPVKRAPAPKVGDVLNGTRRAIMEALGRLPQSTAVSRMSGSVLTKAIDGCWMVEGGCIWPASTVAACAPLTITHIPEQADE